MHAGVDGGPAVAGYTSAELLGMRVCVHERDRFTAPGSNIIPDNVRRVVRVMQVAGAAQRQR